MFYALECAYGAHVVNDGQRADKAYSFTRRELRDAWVAAGPAATTAPGYREVLSARHPAIRKAHFVDDGDSLGWQVLAERRIDNSPALRQHRAILLYDWPDTAHPRWVATAKEAEIVSWAKATEAAAYDSEAAN